jgi:chromosome segregation ATPase
MRHLIRLITIIVLATTLFAAGAQAQSETDRLRDALRTAIAQTRGLEDQRAALQGKLTEAERNAALLKTQRDDAKAQAVQLDKDYRQAVQDFNARLDERNQTLDKWKNAYEEAATVARTKDAERAKFESESKAYKARTGACEAKNTKLIKVGDEVVEGYRDFTLSQMLGASEPLIGISKVDHENKSQDYLDKILEQRVQPGTEPHGTGDK